MAIADTTTTTRAHAFSRLFPWLVLAGTAASCLWLVSAYGFRSPRGDEWDWLPVLAGEQPLTLQWLWSQHYDHRMFLPRLIYVGLGRLTGCNFQAGAYFNVALLTLLSVAMMFAARRLRGGPHWSDAFFPLAMLHWGHFLNFGWGIQLNFVTSVFLVGIVVIVMAQSRQRLSVPAALLAAACAIGAGLCGSYGLAYLPPIALWLAMAARSEWRKQVPQAGRCLVLAGLSAVIVGFIPLYLHGLTHPAPPNAVQAGPLDQIRTGLEFLCGGFGLAGKEIGPAASVLVFAAVAVSIHCAVRAFRRRDELPSAVGLLGIYAGVAAMACGIGAGRACLGAGAGYSAPYLILLVPALCVFYLQSLTTDNSSLWRRLPVALCLLMCLVAAINTWKGWHAAQALSARQRAVEIDARDGLSPVALAARYCDWSIFEPTEAISREHYEALWRKRLGPFRGLSSESRPNGTVVRRLHRTGDAAASTETHRFAVGQPLCEQFTVGGPAVLSRIDVDLGWNTRGPRAADWELAEVDAAGAARRLAGGQVRLDRAVVRGTALLAIQPLRIEKGRALRLTLEVPRDAGPAAFLFVPLYPSDPAMSPRSPSVAPTFLFLTAPGAGSPTH